MYSIYRKSIS